MARALAFDDPRLADLVADNLHKFENDQDPIVAGVGDFLRAGAKALDALLEAWQKYEHRFAALGS